MVEGQNRGEKEGRESEGGEGGKGVTGGRGREGVQSGEREGRGWFEGGERG